jgi:hypothetical protein
MGRGKGLGARLPIGNQNEFKTEKEPMIMGGALPYNKRFKPPARGRHLACDLWDKFFAVHAIGLPVRSGARLSSRTPSPMLEA